LSFCERVGIGLTPARVAKKETPPVAQSPFGWHALEVIRVLAALWVVCAPISEAKAAPGGGASRGVEALGQGVMAVRHGNAKAAVPLLKTALAERVRNDDYVRFYLGLALRVQGELKEALRLFEGLSHQKNSRFAGPADWLSADLMWQTGAQRDAVKRYTGLLKAMRTEAPSSRDRQGIPPGSPLLHIDPALAHFRLATNAPNAVAKEHLLAIVTNYPGSSLAEQSATRLNTLRGDTAQVDSPKVELLSASAKLKQAETLTRNLELDHAIAILRGINEALPEPLATQRDFLLGKALYQTRHNYDESARLLLDLAQRLPAQDADWAAFHGARALARADHDDEAIVQFRKMVARFPRSTWAPEAQFMAGFLAFNQGKFAAAIPDLKQTATAHAKSAFSANALWYLSLAHALLEKPGEALTYLASFDRRSDLRPELRPRERSAYFRALWSQKLGKIDEARDGWRQLVLQEPFGWYGLMAASQLRTANQPDPLSLPVGKDSGAQTSTLKTQNDLQLQRIDELVAAGLPEDAGVELERSASDLLKRYGNGAGLQLLIERSQTTGAYARSYRSASSVGQSALSQSPVGQARAIWQASYPRAYHTLVEQFGVAAGNPPHLLHAIMRKESGFDPLVVSYADARGLMQMIPGTSTRVAQELGLPFSADALFDPALNLRLAATYIGSLHRKFGQQAPLTFGAFNGGPRAMQRFCERFGQYPTDIFAELVTFPQTREYIKRTSSNYARYLYLYDAQRWLPPPSFDCRVTQDGPNY
jgi:soluble lytic murein transglycosylase